MADKVSRIHPEIRPGGSPIDTGGGGFDDGGMEARVAKVEAAVEFIQETMKDIKTDIRELRAKIDTHFLILSGMIITAALGLAWIMAKGFNWL